MPFDSLPTKHPRADELAILDRMAEILATPDRWCQRSLVTTDGSFCLIGAARVAVADVGFLHDPMGIFVALMRFTGGMLPATFNDTHTHTEVLDLIARARRTFEHDGSLQE